MTDQVAFPGFQLHPRFMRPVRSLNELMVVTAQSTLLYRGASFLCTYISV